MSLLVVLLIIVGIILIYYGITGKRPQEVVKEALSNG